MWILKTVLQARLSSEQYFRPDAAEVTTADIKVQRPVNVSSSFFYINSLPISNWIVAPPLSSSYLNRRTCARAYAHVRASVITRAPVCTYTSGGVMGTSGGAHPMHGQTFPGEHQKNHQRGFKQPATANTNTRGNTHTDTHLLGAEVKARSDEPREQRASLCTLRLCSTEA